jgi:hypothetical protein
MVLAAHLLREWGGGEAKKGSLEGLGKRQPSLKIKKHFQDLWLSLKPSLVS